MNHLIYYDFLLFNSVIFRQKNSHIPNKHSVLALSNNNYILKWLRITNTICDFQIGVFQISDFQNSNYLLIHNLCSLLFVLLSNSVIYIRCYRILSFNEKALNIINWIAGKFAVMLSFIVYSVQLIRIIIQSWYFMLRKRYPKINRID